MIIDVLRRDRRHVAKVVFWLDLPIEESVDWSHHESEVVLVSRKNAAFDIDLFQRGVVSVGGRQILVQRKPASKRETRHEIVGR